MKLDSKQQQSFLLEMFRVATIPGQIIDIAVAVKRAIEGAEISEASSTESPEVARLRVG